MFKKSLVVITLMTRFICGAQPGVSPEYISAAVVFPAETYDAVYESMKPALRAAGIQSENAQRKHLTLLQYNIYVNLPRGMTKDKLVEWQKKLKEELNAKLKSATLSALNDVVYEPVIFRVVNIGIYERHLAVIMELNPFAANLISGLTRTIDRRFRESIRSRMSDGTILDLKQVFPEFKPHVSVGKITSEGVPTVAGLSTRNIPDFVMSSQSPISIRSHWTQKMEKPVSSMEDIFWSKMTGLLNAPQTVSVSTGELPRYAVEAARPVGGVELHPAAVPARASPISEAAVLPVYRPAVAERGAYGRVLIPSEKPSAAATTDVNIGRPTELAMWKATYLPARAEVSAGLVDSDWLNSAYHLIKDEFQGFLYYIQLEPEINPKDYRMDLATFEISFNSAAKFDSSYIDELLKGVLNEVVRTVLNVYSPLFNLQYFGIVSGYVAAVFESESLGNVVREIDRDLENQKRFKV